MMSAAGKIDPDVWMHQVALPLWSGAGLDPKTHLPWEALSHDGGPLEPLPRRLRVFPRQAYCFAALGQTEIARDLFDRTMACGFDPDTGALVARFSSTLERLEAPNDLYDLAFMLLAASALTRAGQDMSAALERVAQNVALLQADRGWYEASTPRPMRRQNPHMHLFEATIDLYDVTRDTRWRDMADICLGLLQDVFLSSQGDLLEFFSDDWQPVSDADQQLEPGHMAEWVYLLDRYEQVTGQGTGVDLDRLFHRAWAHRDAFGLLPDTAAPSCSTRRLWPQTELLKASAVLKRRGHDVPQAAHPDAVFAAMWAQYFEGPIAGGWYDKRSTDGTLLSDTMPASTFYHIVVALRAYQAR